MRRRRHCHRHHHFGRRRRRFEREFVSARVENEAEIGNISGLINIPIQIPINLGDANAFSDVSGSATANNIL